MVLCRAVSRLSSNLQTSLLCIVWEGQVEQLTNKITTHVRAVTRSTTRFSRILCSPLTATHSAHTGALSLLRVLPRHSCSAAAASAGLNAIGAPRTCSPDRPPPLATPCVQAEAPAAADVGCDDAEHARVLHACRARGGGAPSGGFHDAVRAARGAGRAALVGRREGAHVPAALQACTRHAAHVPRCLVPEGLPGGCPVSGTPARRGARPSLAHYCAPGNYCGALPPQRERGRASIPAVARCPLRCLCSTHQPKEGGVCVRPLSSAFLCRSRPGSDLAVSYVESRSVRGAGHVPREKFCFLATITPAGTGP